MLVEWPVVVLEATERWRESGLKVNHFKSFYAFDIFAEKPVKIHVSLDLKQKAKVIMARNAGTPKFWYVKKVYDVGILAADEIIADVDAWLSGQEPTVSEPESIRKLPELVELVPLFIAEIGEQLTLF